MAITGHSQGLGKEVFDHFSLQKNFEVFGFSRSNGWDLALDEKRSEMANEIKDFDIFINNAPLGFNAIDLLDRVFSFWVEEKKMIINISSSSASRKMWSLTEEIVQSEKVALNAHTQVLHARENRNCRLTTLSPGPFESSYVSTVEESVLQKKSIVDAIDWITKLPEDIEIRQLTINQMN